MLKPHHHIKLTMENKADLQLWLHFLQHPSIYSRPFADFSENSNGSQEKFFTDASKNVELGCGGWNDNEWFVQRWDASFIQEKEPSIAYLEQRIVIRCDNQAVVQMTNNMTSSCRNCMVLIRLIVLECLIQNVKISVSYVESCQNDLADALSRMSFERFWRIVKQRNLSMDETSREIP